MLGAASPMGFLSVSDFASARIFYEETLGLTFVSQNDFALVLRTGPIVLRVTVPPKLIIPPYTVFGWQVESIDINVAALSAKGVTFEFYGFLASAQDVYGVWTAPSGDKVAWFKDPDGNLLSLSQHGA